MNTIDLLQKRWDDLKDEIDLLNQYPPNESLRKRIRHLKNEASIIRFAIEDVRCGQPKEIILENLRSNRAFYNRVREKNES